MAKVFSENVLHEPINLDHVGLYTFYVDDQIVQAGKAAVAVLRKGKHDLLAAIDCMSNDVLAICTLMQVDACLLVEERIRAHVDFFSSGLAGNAEQRLLYLCHDQECNWSVGESDFSDGRNRDVPLNVVKCATVTTFHEIKQTFFDKKLTLTRQLVSLAQSRRWNISFEGCVMGLHCRVSEMSNVLLMLNKERPLSHQINAVRQLTLLSDVAIYLLHLYALLSNTGEDWSDNGMLKVRPLSSRPTAVLD